MGGSIQNQDIKSEAELIAGGATKSSLPNDDKAYINAFALDKTFREALKAFDLGTGDTPLRIYPNQTTADAKLYFKGNARQVIDGTSKITAPLNGTIGSFVDSSIDWQTGTITGGTFLYNGVAFTFPSTTVGQHRRFAFAMQSDGTIAVNYSAQAASVGALPNAGTLFTTLIGIGIGYIDLEATAATAFKTSGSATSVIEAKVGGVSRIWWFGGGAGGGSSSSIPFTLTNNQSTPADITGFLVNKTNHHAFNAEYLVERSYKTTGSAGTSDTGFVTNTGSSAGGSVYSTPIQSDGKILVAGSFTTFNGNTRNGLIRLNADGTEDTAFYTNLNGAVGFSAAIFFALIQPDGKILCCGTFTSFGGNTRNNLIRLNADGTEDTSFYTNLSGGTTGFVYRVAVQDDGKIVVVGAFTTFGGNTRNKIIRLNQDGTEDSAFYTATSGGFTGTRVVTATLQPDGKIICGGAFTAFGGNTRNHLVRLNSTGSEDSSFYTNLGTGGVTGTSVEAVTLQPDKKILVGGTFTAVGTNTRNSLVRLDSTGLDDAAFYTSLGTGGVTGAAPAVSAIALHQFGKIVVSGAFSAIGANTRTRIARLNSDGTDDSVFYGNIPGGLSNNANSINIQTDGDIVLGGFFVTAGGVTVNRVTRRNGDLFTENIKKGRLLGIYSPADAEWKLTDGEYAGTDSPGITFSMTVDGQLQYTSTDLSSYGSVVTDLFRFFIVEL